MLRYNIKAKDPHLRVNCLKMIDEKNRLDVDRKPFENQGQSL